MTVASTLTENALQVIVVWALDTLHQGLIVHSCYAYLVTNYANMLFLLTITPSLSVRSAVAE